MLSKLRLKSLTKPLTGLLFLFLSLFCFWLMFHTFSYDPSTSQLLVSSKVWSDFGANLPLIRSFSLGQNWPPEHPLYPGEKIRYHYLFYLLVGGLEKLGLRIDWALNLPSALGMFLLIIFIWKVSQALFKSLLTSLLSIVFFLFNSSFSFLDFLSTHPLSSLSLAQITSNSQFSSFAPWNESIITAFWNLNIYTNQRHLPLSFALVLLIVYLLLTLKPKLLYLTGFFMGVLLLLNQAAFVISVIFVFFVFIFSFPSRRPLFISLLGLIPWLVLYRLTVHTDPSISFKLGYLTPSPFSLSNFFKFWFYNLGLQLFLIPLGFIVSPRHARILVLPLIVLFVVPNLLQLSPDLVNNHKFFNFFIIISGMFSAYAISRFWSAGLVKKIITVIFFPLLILGGIIDFFPVKNDFYYRISDVSSNPESGFFSTIAPNSIVLNSLWFYHPASIAGRPIFNGYSYFTWSYGYNQVSREKITTSIYAAPSMSAACQLLLNYNISYVELSRQPESFIQPNWGIWDSEFVPDYTNPVNGTKIFSVFQNCSET